MVCANRREGRVVGRDYSLRFEGGQFLAESENPAGARAITQSAKRQLAGWPIRSGTLGTSSARTISIGIGPVASTAS